MGRPDDANPLHASLASETITRTRKAEKKNATEAGGPAVSVDRKTVLAMKAGQRIKWLDKALRQALDGRLQASDLFDVVSTKKFVEGIEGKPGMRISRLLREHLELFSLRQQRQLKEGAPILTKFAGKGDGDSDDEQEQAAGSQQVEAAEAQEDMMSRIRDFVRVKAQGRDNEPEIMHEPEPMAADISEGSGAVEHSARVAGMFKMELGDKAAVTKNALEEAEKEAIQGGAPPERQEERPRSEDAAKRGGKNGASRSRGRSAKKKRDSPSSRSSRSVDRGKRRSQKRSRSASSRSRSRSRGRRPADKGKRDEGKRDDRRNKDEGKTKRKRSRSASRRRSRSGSRRRSPSSRSASRRRDKSKKQKKDRH